MALIDDDFKTIPIANACKGFADIRAELEKASIALQKADREYREIKDREKVIEQILYERMKNKGVVILEDRAMYAENRLGSSHGTIIEVSVLAKHAKS